MKFNCEKARLPAISNRLDTKGLNRRQERMKRAVHRGDGV